MKKIVLILLVMLVFSIAAFGMTYIGGGFMREFGGYNRTFAEARLTMGSGMTFDILGHLILSNMNPAYFLQLYTYLNASFQLSNSNLELYAGFSPTWFFGNGSFSQYDFYNHGYFHAGAAYKMNQFRIYGELGWQLYYSPLSLGSVPMGTIGAQFGF